MKPSVHIFSTKPEFYTDEKCFITENYNVPTDPNLSIAQARVPVGITTEWHLVKNTVERYLILSGTGRMEVGDVVQDVSYGDVVIIPPNVKQRITNTGDTDLMISAMCTPRFIPENYVDDFDPETVPTPQKPSIHKFDPETEFFIPEGCYITENVNTPTLSIAQARVPIGVTTQWHRLVDTTEWYLILDGTGRMYVGDIVQDVAYGDVVVIPPMTPQRITNTGKGELFLSALCTPGFKQEVYEDIEDEMANS